MLPCPSPRGRTRAAPACAAAPDPHAGEAPPRRRTGPRRRPARTRAPRNRPAGPCGRGRLLPEPCHPADGHPVAGDGQLAGTDRDVVDSEEDPFGRRQRGLAPGSPASASTSAPAVPIRLRILGSMCLTFPPACGCAGERPRRDALAVPEAPSPIIAFPRRALYRWGSVGQCGSGRCCILRCMSATRTQVYLEPRQRRRLDEIAGAQGRSFASIVREAVDCTSRQAPVDPTRALASTFGAAPDAETPARDDWTARDARLGADE